MGDRIAGAPHGRWVNWTALTALGAVSAWAFTGSFTRELLRPPEARSTPAKVVVLAPPPPASGLEPLRTYALEAPRPIVRHKSVEPPAPVMAPSEAILATGAPSAETVGIPASDIAPEPQQPQPSTPPSDPG